MLDFHSHLTLAAEYEYRTYFQLLQTQLKQKIQQYTATDFQGWPKLTLKIKTTYFLHAWNWVSKNSLTAIYRITQESLK